ncbi:hypothetical protein JAAARDRAFT_198465 [Jaapia argillacea MUCL 33604]|uniref:Uncharacterized protein n=1 Tax=Jaapia argillacea MUCL 33604 TaxID=933084 RepID=A0A067PBY8_9AGAM|nr:hypothetical protein JAAARDRAFT_198465 [Jaapia argillacea MUCL 33604]
MSSTTLDSPAVANYDPLEFLANPNFDPSDPPVILLFVYHTIFARGRPFTKRCFSDMIEGHNSVANTWILWRPGGEEWLRSNLRRDGGDWLLDGDTWKIARERNRRRVDRLAGHGVSDLWPASVKERIWKADTPTRASTIAWLILVLPFITQRRIYLDLDSFNFSNLIGTWIHASGNLLVSQGLPIQPLTGFVETLPDSGHICSFWDSSASS